MPSQVPNQLTLSDWLSLAGTILGPLVVGIVIWWLGIRNEDHRVKSEAIRDLMTYRGDYSSPEFRRSLNKVSITFSRDAATRKQIRELYEAINNNDANVDRKIVGVIYSLCQKNGYNQLTEYDIDQSFPEQNQVPTGDKLPIDINTPAVLPNAEVSSPAIKSEKEK